MKRVFTCIIFCALLAFPTTAFAKTRLVIRYKNHQKIIYTNSSSVRHVLDKYRANKDVLAADVDHYERFIASNAATNDPMMRGAWEVEQIGADKTWNTTPSVPITVAVIDSGVQLDHPDLIDKFVPGYDFVDHDTDPTDPDPAPKGGHGTHVSGIIAAIPNNGIGVYGIAPAAHIMPIRALTAEGGYDSDIALSITWATDHGANIINLSLGGSSYNSVLHQALVYAYSHGVALVCSSGNSGTSTLQYPASDPLCASVTALNPADEKPDWAEYGAGVGGGSLQFAAPGVSILSTYIGSGYEYFSGTSMAAPVISGALAVLMGQGETRDQALFALKQTATDLGDPGYDTTYGYGRINLDQAINLPVGTVAPLALPTCAANLDGVLTNTTIKMQTTCQSSEPLSYAVVSRPRFGRVSFMGNTLTYKATNPNHAFTDTFIFHALTAGSPDVQVTIIHRLKKLRLTIHRTKRQLTIISSTAAPLHLLVRITRPNGALKDIRLTTKRKKTTITIPLARSVRVVHMAGDGFIACQSKDA